MRWFLSRHVVVPALVVLIIGTIVLYMRTANAEPVARAQADNGHVTLYNDPCELKTVSNLRFKAVWMQDGKEFSGCWDQHPMGLILAFFDDLTVVLIHPQSFQPVRSM